MKGYGQTDRKGKGYVRQKLNENAAGKGLRLDDGGNAGRNGMWERRGHTGDSAVGREQRFGSGVHAGTDSGDYGCAHTGSHGFSDAKADPDPGTYAFSNTATHYHKREIGRAHV